MKFSLSQTLVLGLIGLAEAWPAAPPKPEATPTQTTVQTTVPRKDASSSVITEQKSQVTPSPSLKSARSTDRWNFLFSSSGDWLNIPCDAPGLTDARVDPAERWKTASADDAWNQLMAGYKEYLKEDDGKPMEEKYFDAYAFNAFHGADYPWCNVLDSSTCMDTVQCDGRPPAVFLILNSLVAIHRVMQYTNTKLGELDSIVEPGLRTFQDAFTAMPKNLGMHIMKWILDSLLFGANIASAFTWNVYIRNAAVFADDNYRGAWKDVMNGALAFGIIMPKDGMKAPTSPSETTELLREWSGQFFNTTGLIQSRYLDNVMKAHDEEYQDLLTDMVKDGAMYLFLENPPDYAEAQEEAAKLFYGRLLPFAWSISPEKQKPFILRVDRKDYTCGDKPEGLGGKHLGKWDLALSRWMSDETALKSQWCDPQGNTWMLLNAKFDNEATLWSDMYMGLLAGGDTDNLNGKNWGGITIEDIVRSSYGGFLANGKKNGYSMPEKSGLTLSKNAGDVKEGDLPFEGSIRTAGFFNFTICLNGNEAYNNIVKGNKEICGESPIDIGVTPPVNDAGYAPDWCTIHLTQWQRNAGELNPFDKFQLQITIFDAANTILMQATKQVMDPAVKISSVLPYDLYVQPGAEDNDPVCLWYGDQWWCTNDQAHQCMFGQWDNNKREGDCGFKCPNPTGKPSGDPPRALPADAFKAYIGHGDLPDVPAPATEYKGGWCGVYLKQYQRNENKDAQNPFNDYAIELYLKDAEGKMIAYSPKTFAKKGGDAARVKGPLPHALEVWPGEGDEDPLSFNYNGQKWDSHNQGHCGSGGDLSIPDSYDSGWRDGNCGFPC